MTVNKNHTIQLIVGLGNPGEKYANTRHNAGAWFALALANIERVHWNANPRLKGFETQLSHNFNHCRLLLPMTFMNLSGEAVQAFTHFYKISPDNILVAHDDLDLPIGTVRLKHGGGHGGHNGLRDIDDKLGTNQYNRLRIGIGRPLLPGQDVVNYVLNRPTAAEQQDIEAGMQRVLEHIEPLIYGDWQKVVHQLHTKIEK